MKTARQLLKQYKIAITEQRLAILIIFLNTNEMLNHHLVEKKAEKIISRYTIYRTLKLFLKKGLLHVLPSEDGIIWYLLRLHSGIGTAYTNAYFLCRKCGKIYFLADISLPDIKTP